MRIPELTVRLQNLQVQYSSGSIPTLGTIPSQERAYSLEPYLLTCTLGISKRISARKHISTSILVTMTSKTPNQETRVPFPSTPLYWQHKLPIRKICFWWRRLGDTLLSSGVPSRNPVVSPNRARVTTLVNSQPQTPNGVFCHHHHHLFAQNTIKFDNGYVNEQDRKAHCALTSAHNITSTVERNTHNTIHGIGVTRNR